jgi:hypothetical protein
MAMAGCVPPIAAWVRRAQAGSLVDAQVAGQARVLVAEDVQAVAPAADHTAVQAVAAMDARMAEGRQVDRAADHAPP